jgi:hypothetical protein
MPKVKDPETTAMQTIALLLAPLSPDERERIVRWADDRYVMPSRLMASEGFKQVEEPK